MNKVIVRGDRSGLFFGELVSRSGKEVKLKNCRRLWYWEGAATINQLAVDGTCAPLRCKFTIAVPEIEILDAVEILYCTAKAADSISNVAIWKLR
ncbi:MAG: hypothetical protein KBT13_01525 [Bacteroidales bacterium]|uniref:DUF6948 domain-containing protein n=1 Tax=Sodaliphilus sp. TaxID=2815818 RepID=UPI001B43E999|nr:hypothetical protein [Candidatus Sodaliphilus limicaballi]